MLKSDPETSPIIGPPLKEGSALSSPWGCFGNASLLQVTYPCPGNGPPQSLSRRGSQPLSMVLAPRLTWEYRNQSCTWVWVTWKCWSVSPPTSEGIKVKRKLRLSPIPHLHPLLFQWEVVSPERQPSTFPTWGYRRTRLHWFAFHRLAGENQKGDSKTKWLQVLIQVDRV